MLGTIAELYLSDPQKAATVSSMPKIRIVITSIKIA